MSQTPHGQTRGQLQGLQPWTAEDVDVVRPPGAQVDAPGHQRVVVAGGQQHPHRFPGGEGLDQELGGLGPRALVLEEVAADRHGPASPLLGDLASSPERLPQPLAAAPGQLPVAAHQGEGAVEVEVGEVEEPVRHLVRNSLRTSVRE